MCTCSFRVEVKEEEKKRPKRTCFFLAQFKRNEEYIVDDLAFIICTTL